MIWKLDEFLSSKKVKMCLLVLGLTFVGLMAKRMDGMSFAAVVSSIVIIYNHTQSKTDVAALHGDK